MESEKDIFRLAEMIVKSFREELLPEEQEILDHWLEETADNRERYNRYAGETFLEQKNRLSTQINWQKDYQQFLEKHEIKPRRTLNRTWFHYAAVIVMLFSVGSLFWLRHSGQSEEKVAVTTEKPQQHQATLTLSGGKQVILSDTTQLQEIDGTIVSGQSGLLTYKPEEISEPEKVIYHKLEIPRGAEYLLALADGSKVWLNSESVIHYPVQFKNEKREVYIEGEAFFKVAHDTTHPFIVHAGNTEIEVLGTEFNVRNYLDETKIATTLVQGSVRLTSDKDHQKIVLKPGEQGNIDKESGKLTSWEVDTYLYTAWKDSRFVFRNTRMEDLLTTLARWYDLNIFYQNPEAKNIHFSGDMSRMEDFHELLNIIENNERVRFTVHNQNVTVSLK